MKNEKQKAVDPKKKKNPWEQDDPTQLQQPQAEPFDEGVYKKQRHQPNSNQSYPVRVTQPR